MVCLNSIWFRNNEWDFHFIIQDTLWNHAHCSLKAQHSRIKFLNNESNSFSNQISSIHLSQTDMFFKGICTLINTIQRPKFLHCAEEIFSCRVHYMTDDIKPQPLLFVLQMRWWRGRHLNGIYILSQTFWKLKCVSLIRRCTWQSRCPEKGTIKYSWEEKEKLN